MCSKQDGAGARGSVLDATSGDFHVIPIYFIMFSECTQNYSSPIQLDSEYTCNIW